MCLIIMWALAIIELKSGYEMFCAVGTICTTLKNVKNTHGGVFSTVGLLLKLQIEEYNFTY